MLLLLPGTTQAECISSSGYFGQVETVEMYRMGFQRLHRSRRQNRFVGHRPFIFSTKGLSSRFVSPCLLGWGRIVEQLLVVGGGGVDGWWVPLPKMQAAQSRRDGYKVRQAYGSGFGPVSPLGMAPDFR